MLDVETIKAEAAKMKTPKKGGNGFVPVSIRPGAFTGRDGGQMLGLWVGRSWLSLDAVAAIRSLGDDEVKRLVTSTGR